jgi:hypothetical protein
MYVQIIKANKIIKMKEYKRKFRERDEVTKMKISNSLRNRTKSATHRQAISQGLKNYWETVPSMKNNDMNNSNYNE